MLHDILLALIKNTNPTNNWGEVITNFMELDEFIHPGDLKLLEKIIEIINDYNYIIESIEKFENTITGSYIKAFINGIREIINEYNQEIVDLEKKLLENPNLSLSLILSEIENYRKLFDELKQIIRLVESNNLRGCLLIGRLQKYLFSGDSRTADAANQIIKSLNTVFYTDLCHWIIYGELNNIHDEFFIINGQCPDENFLYPDQMNETTTTTSNPQKRTRIKRPPIVQKFTINPAMLPVSLAVETAEKILFIGRIVWIVRNAKTDAKIWDEDDMIAYQNMFAMELQTHNSQILHDIIEKYRLKLTRYLWHLMMNDGNILEHLHLIRDYYGLGRGELFNLFMNTAEMRANQSPYDEIQNLNCIFNECSRKIYGDNDETYQRFELDFNRTDNQNLWLKLQLNFEIHWPLHIVFHPKAMDLYNKLFNYLLNLKKTHRNLLELWKLHRNAKQYIDRRVWTLRQHLAFLVNNLLYYLQVDVIEAEFSLLIKSIRNANGFEDILKLHHEFMNNLLAKTFIMMSDEVVNYEIRHDFYQKPMTDAGGSNNKIYNVIMHLLELCDKFCIVASTWGIELTDIEVVDLDNFQKRTDIIVKSLLFILYSLHGKVKGQHLLQLLYQLDFNQYFSKNKSDFHLLDNLL